MATEARPTLALRWVDSKRVHLKLRAGGFIVLNREYENADVLPEGMKAFDEEGDEVNPASLRGIAEGFSIEYENERYFMENRPKIQANDLAVEGPPMKRRKIRDTNKDAKVESHKWIDLTVNKFKILTPNASDSVRYYGREGMQELFDQLVDSREGVEDFNIELIGAPGTGKSNLAWAVAEHLGTTEDVIWVGRRSNSHRWEVFQFRDGNVYGFDDLPKQLSDILELDAFDNSEVLIVDAPIDVSDAAQSNQGPAAYSWASNVAYHHSRRGKRRVIHVSSLGAAAKKEEDRRAINVEGKIMRPFTRRDYIKGLEDQELKEQVCKTLNIVDASSVTAEDLVDSKFYYSGINARWFFNFTIEKIQDECKKIIGRMDDSTVTTGDKHREAVNSALQRYPD